MAPSTDVRLVVVSFCRALAGQGVRSGSVFLFGSWARGQQREDSDIDLAVVSPDFIPMGYWERIEVLGIECRAR